MDRPRCAAFLAMSLDGFIARPDGRFDWLDRYQTPGQDHGFAAFFAAIDTMLLGRATWEVVLGFPEWPYAGKRVAVLTHRPAGARHGEILLAGAPGEALERLASEGARRVYVDGGAVVSQVLAAGLLDELTVTVVPVVLGTGIRLFQGAPPERWLRLAGSQAYPSGLVQLRYEAGATPAPPGSP
jgi:dihydrofolate reductase